MEAAILAGFAESSVTTPGRYAGSVQTMVENVVDMNEKQSLLLAHRTIKAELDLTHHVISNNRELLSRKPAPSIPLDSISSQPSRYSQRGTRLWS